jgi:hypothetical protein
MHNVDIWGMMAIYYELIKKPFDNFKLSSKEYKTYIQMLINLLVKNIFENGNKVINIGRLVHDIKKVNLFLHKLNPHEEYRKNMNKITQYEDIVSENIHEKVGDKSAHQHLSNNMKIKDSIVLRKLQLNKTLKRSQMHLRERKQRQIEDYTMSKPNLSRSDNRHNRTQRINVIKL